MRTSYYDPMAAISLDRDKEVSPPILEYLRSEVARHKSQRPAALMRSPGAFISLPQFRILYPSRVWMGNLDGSKWGGRVDKIFVVLSEEVGEDDAELILRSFTDYDFDKWRYIKLDRMIIYTQ
jgi:hypothetical protein